MLANAGVYTVSFCTCASVRTWASCSPCVQELAWKKCLLFTESARSSLTCLLVLFSGSVMSDSATPWTAARQSLSFTISWSLLKFMSIALVMPSNHLILCCPLFLLPSIFPSIRVFSNKLALCIRWPKAGVSASAPVLPVNSQGLFPLGLTGWISLPSKGLLRILSSTTIQKW